MKYRGGSDESHPKETFRSRLSQETFGISQETFYILAEKVLYLKKLFVRRWVIQELAGNFLQLAGKFRVPQMYKAPPAQKN